MPPRIRGSAVCSSQLRSPSLAISLVSKTQSKALSTTPRRNVFTKQRQEYRAWERNAGKKYLEPQDGPNYITTSTVPNSTRPFPLNQYFKSMPVLGEQARELVWEKVMRNGDTIKAVSAEFGIDVKRVAAVVRLKEIEKEWSAKGKTLARPYARAVLSMVPSRSFDRDKQNRPFEPINEVHMHKYTRQQVFWPTSESREFNRADAAKAFHDTMLPADERVPHPELIQMERDLLEGKSMHESKATFIATAEKNERKAAAKVQQKALLAERDTVRLDTGRFEFRFKQINADDAGPQGRSVKGTGWRYGVPFYDRRRGEVKIPTQVPDVGTYHNQQRA